VVRHPTSKFISREAAPETAQRLHSAGKKIVTTNGCFDLLHLGHLRYLFEARAQGDVLWIGLNSDASVKRLKGPQRPLQEEQVRAEQLAALECVDYVTLFPEDTPEDFLERVRPSVHIKGGDYSPETLPERKVVEAHGGSLLCLGFVPGFSTTALIEKIKQS
jgi:D-glycero-beta-D-manno-heptose 1-phosphate adenylyltransferase